ncbi:bifunctional folylpolyglutamate synthase/dihydrofolate synthase [Anthocerotibacter panamensis]|uniref:bifunctional folylpolyglutamate synthase/dihydrofolate synthase n=1 Tax=Anthocerotibacter panamensis TaxID=2857077 RepID=UPI001C40197E|nr:folylpolyglutamate synthase/dihydrofolate synthase family protein [Anthocerotibacter panamensis]
MAFYASFLDHLQPFGIRLGLSRMTELMTRLEDPQDQVPCIHVAGTNGKGSTCALVRAMLQAAGYRVGCYTSPHLVDWRERITVQGRPISAKDLDESLLTLQPHLKKLPSVTQFEAITAAAFVYFARQNLDVMVIEVGLGGRLDATNAVRRPRVTAITSIGLDHCNILGETLAAIANEKAGILKPGVPMLTALLPPEAQAVVQTRATERGCPVWIIPPATMSGVEYTALDLTYSLALKGPVQAQNSSLALGICQELITQGWSVPVEARRSGLAQARWPGRYQSLTYQGHELLIDGAHNPEGAQFLRQFVDHWQMPVSWIVGLLTTKDSAAILKHLLAPADEFWAVPVPSGSSYAPSLLAATALDLQPGLTLSRAVADIPTALQQAKNPCVLCGSLYLIGDFLAYLGYTPETLAG